MPEDSSSANSIWCSWGTETKWVISSVINTVFVQDADYVCCCHRGYHFFVLILFCNILHNGLLFAHFFKHIFALMTNVRLSWKFYFIRIDTTASETYLIIITHSSPVQITILTRSAWRSTKGVNWINIRLYHLSQTNFYILKGFCYS